VELEDLEVFENISRDLMTGASVLVRSEATVKGNIHAAEIVVSGIVNGNLKASLRVKLESTARVSGTIEAPSIELANGATVRGDLKIGPKQTERT
jgi:cytoskeletal protein CcmA (bactofilin family)